RPRATRARNAGGAAVKRTMASSRRAILKLGIGAAAFGLRDVAGLRAAAAAPSIDPRERRLAELRQLTAGGQNAEAYFDVTGTRLVFQSTRPPFDCDQIFTMHADGTDARLVSTGKGRTTCAFFFPDSTDTRLHFLFASTHQGGSACPAAPDRSAG